MAQEDVFKKIVSHCKEYGFVFPSSEIYDGLGAVYDYGQNGVELKNKKVEEALNAQINAEMWSAYLYLSMAAYCHANGNPGMGNWFQAR